MFSAIYIFVKYNKVGQRKQNLVHNYNKETNIIRWPNRQVLEDIILSGKKIMIENAEIDQEK